jgi:hypothetical protein
VEQAKLNGVEKQVTFYNLTVALEGQEDTIRIGRVFALWYIGRAPSQKSNGDSSQRLMCLFGSVALI